MTTDELTFSFSYFNIRLSQAVNNFVKEKGFYPNELWLGYTEYMNLQQNLDYLLYRENNDLGNTKVVKTIYRGLKVRDSECVSDFKVMYNPYYE